MSATRGQLGFRWGSFVFLWCGAVLLVRDAVNILACSAENLELEEGSPKELYSGGTRDYMNWASRRS